MGARYHIETDSHRMRHGDAATISVVIPAYNSEPFIADAIESVLAQTVPPDEIIVVDDGSTDRTADVLQRFGSRVHLLQQANKGPSAARNRGAAAARSAWLAFIDADDTWLPTKLQRQLEIAAAEDVKMVYTDRFNVGNKGALPDVQSQVQRLYRGDVFLDLLQEGNHISLSSVLIDTALFQTLGGFAEHIRSGEDWDLWIRLAERHRIGVVEEPLLRYRFHATMSSGAPRKMRAGRNEVVERALATPRGQALGGRLRRRIRSVVAMTNANDASKHGDRTLAVAEYVRALRLDPAYGPIYADFLRFLLGRHN
jgi:glycosyltransferase involved in cell wall biosynthesis